MQRPDPGAPERKVSWLLLCFLVPVQCQSFYIQADSKERVWFIADSVEPNLVNPITLNLSLVPYYR